MHPNRLVSIVLSYSFTPSLSKMSLDNITFSTISTWPIGLIEKGWINVGRTIEIGVNLGNCINSSFLLSITFSFSILYPFIITKIIWTLWTTPSPKHSTAIAHTSISINAWERGRETYLIPIDLIIKSKLIGINTPKALKDCPCLTYRPKPMNFSMKEFKKKIKAHQWPLLIFRMREIKLSLSSMIQSWKTMKRV